MSVGFCSIHSESDQLTVAARRRGDGVTGHHRGVLDVDWGGGSCRRSTVINGRVPMTRDLAIRVLSEGRERIGRAIDRRRLAGAV